MICQLFQFRPVSRFVLVSSLNIYDHSLKIYGYSLKICEILQLRWIFSQITIHVGFCNS